MIGKECGGKKAVFVINAKGGDVTPLFLSFGFACEMLAFAMGPWHLNCFLPLHSYCVINTSGKGLKTTGDTSKH